MNLKSKSKCLSKQIGKLLCVLLIALYIGVCCLQNNDDTEYKTVIYMLLFITTVILDVLPTTVTCFLVTGLLSLLGLVSDMWEALVGFSNLVLTFIVASFGIVQAMSNTSLMSSIVSSVPTCILFFTITKNAGEERVTKKWMIGIPVSGIKRLSEALWISLCFLLLIIRPVFVFRLCNGWQWGFPLHRLRYRYAGCYWKD